MENEMALVEYLGVETYVETLKFLLGDNLPDDIVVDYTPIDEETLSAIALEMSEGD